MRSMSKTTLLFRTPNHTVILPIGFGGDKNTISRLRQFADWLDEQGMDWYAPDLAAYRDYLLYERGLAPSSAGAHLSSIRGRYHALLRDRDLLYSLTPPDMDMLHRKAFVDELVERLKNAIDPDAARVKITTNQDRADSDHLRLTSAQAQALMAAPGLDTLKGLRDTAIIALMLCTGIRETELCGLRVDDLKQRLGGSLALRVQQGKGGKMRLVPYGNHEWVLAVIDAWLDAATISEGSVFRSFESAIKRSNPTSNLQHKAMSERAVQKMLASYPIMIDGQLRTVRPHDLRRSYARRLYDAGVAPIAIQQNLGHASLQTTLGYIGTLDVEARKPPAVFVPPFKLSDLKRPSDRLAGF